MESHAQFQLNTKPVYKNHLGMSCWTLEPHVCWALKGEGTVSHALCEGRAHVCSLCKHLWSRLLCSRHREESRNPIWRP